METTRIVYLLRPYFKNIGKRVIKSPKLYFTDTGLLAFLLKYPDAGTLQSGPAAGAIFENFIIMEVLKYKLNHNLLYDLYFYRDSNHNEVDLVLDYGRCQKLLEIKSSRTLKSEFFSTLERISTLFPQSERYLVSLSSEATVYKNSKAIPWHDITHVLKNAVSG
jgi:predicted AAA+ superfamily ATPase